jgi:hypothetical protein
MKIRDAKAAVDRPQGGFTARGKFPVKLQKIRCSEGIPVSRRILLLFAAFRERIRGISTA